MQVVANNLANMSTAGYRAEGVVFAEMVERLPTEGGSVAMTATRGRFTEPEQGSLRQTGGTYDLSIQGDGYFQIETPEGIRLTRNGAFTTNENSELVTMDGYPVLDASGGILFIPNDAKQITFGRDGTLAADDRPVGQVGVMTVADEGMLRRANGVQFVAEGGVQPLENPVVTQGYIEQSNVNPVVELTRMIEVQRAYESAQKLLQSDDERIKEVVRTLGAAG